MKTREKNVKANPAKTPKTNGKKAVETKATSPVVTSRIPVDVLREPQRRILTALNGVKTPIDRKTIAELAEVDVAWCVEYIGSEKDEIRVKNDAKRFPSLKTRGFVVSSSESGKTVYAITANGKKYLVKK